MVLDPKNNVPKPKNLQQQKFINGLRHYEWGSQEWNLQQQKFINGLRPNKTLALELGSTTVEIYQWSQT